MRRREFMTLVGGAAAWPLAANAQQPASSRKIGLLHPGESTVVSARIVAIREGLNDSDNNRDSGIEIIMRLADGDLSRLPALATDLINNHVDAIVAAAPAAVQAAAHATTSIPVMAIDLDRQASEWRRGTLKGVPDNKLNGVPNALEWRLGRCNSAIFPSDSRDRAMGFRQLPTAIGLHASTERDFDTVFAILVQLRAGALVIGADPFFSSRLEQLAALTARRTSFYHLRTFTTVEPQKRTRNRRQARLPQLRQPREHKDEYNPQADQAVPKGPHPLLVAHNDTLASVLCGGDIGYGGLDHIAHDETGQEHEESAA